MKGSLLDYCRRKRTLVLWILGLGMIAGLGWCMVAGWLWKQGYPASYLLGPTEGRFGDFTDETYAAKLPNPYEDSISVYPPSAFVFFRALSFSNIVSLVAVTFTSVAALAFLLARLLQRTVPGTWAPVALAFLFLGLSYPILFGVDRANLELVLIPLIVWALYFFSCRRDVAGAVCLFPAICLKLYPALFLVFLLRRGKVGLVLLCGIGAIALNLVCMSVFEASHIEQWNCYRQNLDFFRNLYLLGNCPLEGSASPWNAYKIILMGLHQVDLIPPVDFDFDGSLIQTSYRIYAVILALVAVGCAGYAWLYERKQVRGVVMLLLLTSIAAPNGADYRLMYASMALFALMLLPGRRRGDWTALVLIALAVIPKKQVLLTFVGNTESGYADVSIQAVLNPVLIVVAMGILLFYSRYRFDWRGQGKRLIDLFFTRWRWI